MDLWEIVEYVGEALVFIGVVGEVLGEWREPENKRLARISSLVLIVGLAVSLAALIGTNEYFNITIAELNLTASQANARAATDEVEAKKADERAALAVAGNTKLAIDLEHAKAETKAKETQLEIEQRKTSVAQKDSLKSLTLFARRAGDRVLDMDLFAKALKNVPKRTVEVWYKADDSEAVRFAGDIQRALQAQNWTVSVRPLTTEVYLCGIPLPKQEGIVVFSRNTNDLHGMDSFPTALEGSIEFGNAGLGAECPDVPEGTLVVSISTRMKT